LSKRPPLEDFFLAGRTGGGAVVTGVAATGDVGTDDAVMGSGATGLYGSGTMGRFGSRLTWDSL
jgi:hypothetical protein